MDTFGNVVANANEDKEGTTDICEANHPNASDKGNISGTFDLRVQILVHRVGDKDL
jgi:hypothetical protein